MKSSLRPLLGLVLALSLPSLAHAAGCCSGVGAAGLDGDWEADKDVKGPKTVSFSHVSYESSRELFAELNADFTTRWSKKTGFKLTVNESHASTETQVRSILLGAEADFVSLDSASAIDELAITGKLLPNQWQSRLPDSSIPYTTTIVFLVEKGNPKQIHTWSDLGRPEVGVITPNPKTSARGQWNYLAAWEEALHTEGNQDKAFDLVSRIYSNAVVLNSSARGSTDSFVNKHKGDVLIVWESEAKEIVAQNHDRKLEIITPPSSLLVELPVAYLDQNIRKHGVERITISFAKYLFSEDAQEIIAQHGYRPRNTEVLADHKADFPSLTLHTISSEFGSWNDAVQKHFSKDGLYDKALLRPSKQVASAQ